MVVALYLLAPAAGWGAELYGRVVRIVDGDTVSVLENDSVQHKVRVAGIDAPERAQSFGRRSRQNLAALVFGKDVRVEWTKRDRYERIIGKLWVSPPDSGCDGAGCPRTLDAGLAQIRDGLAWWYRHYAAEQSPSDRDEYERAEETAKKARLGLWADADAVPPWEFRRLDRSPHGTVTPAGKKGDRQ